MVSKVFEELKGGAGLAVGGLGGRGGRGVVMGLFGDGEVCLAV